MARFSWLRAFIDWCVPASFAIGSARRRRAARAVTFGMSLVMWSPVFVPIYYGLGSPYGALFIACAACGLVVAMMSMRWTESVAVTGNLIAGILFVLLVALAFRTGGLGADSLLWLPAVPIIGLLLARAPAGIVWTACSCLAVLGFFLAKRHGVDFDHDIRDGSLLHLAALSGIILCTALLTNIFRVGEAAAQRQLAKARDESDAANRAKSRFLANMSHEIRTPMNGIIGMGRLLEHTRLQPQQRDYLLTIQDSADALRRILDDILDLSKIEAGRVELEVTTFSLRDTTARVLRTLAPRAAVKDLELACRIDPELRDDLKGDPGRFAQVVFNLVGNAIKFTASGEILLEITSEWETETQTCLRCLVHDTGVGVPPEKRELIFQPFSQADAATTRRFGGTGLGLSISAQLVDMMGGRVWVEESSDSGSVFAFTVVFDHAAEGSAPRRPLLAGVRALVVDDHATNRQVLEEMLVAFGLTVTTAESGAAALEALTQAAASGERFELVLLDLMMPEMDGIELAHAIRAQPELQAPRMILLSSAGHHEEVERSRTAGIRRYLQKPVIESELLDALMDATPVTQATPSLPRASVGRPLRILLVEDAVINQKVAQGLLAAAGHEVRIAANGKEALAAHAVDTYDVILMDLHMPIMDGYDATSSIRRREVDAGDHVPIVAMTAAAMKGDRERCLEAGMDAYVSKPIDADELARVLDEVTQG